MLVFKFSYRAAANRNCRRFFCFQRKTRRNNRPTFSPCLPVWQPSPINAPASFDFNAVLRATEIKPLPDGNGQSNDFSFGDKRSVRRFAVIDAAQI